MCDPCSIAIGKVRIVVEILLAYVTPPGQPKDSNTAITASRVSNSLVHLDHNTSNHIVLFLIGYLFGRSLTQDHHHLFCKL